MPLILKLLKIDYHTYSRGVFRPAAAAVGTPTRIKGNCEKMRRMARERDINYISRPSCLWLVAEKSLQIIACENVVSPARQRNK